MNEREVNGFPIFKSTTWKSSPPNLSRGKDFNKILIEPNCQALGINLLVDGVEVEKQGEEEDINRKTHKIQMK